MVIAQTNYSPLFNAVQARGQANQTKYAAQSVYSQKQGFVLKQRGLDLQGKQLTLDKEYMLKQRRSQNIQLALQGASLLLDAGQKIYGMYEEAQTQKAKIDMVNTAMPAIAQRRMEAVANGEIEITVDENGRQAIQISPEFDEFVQEQVNAISENYKLGSVNTYIESTLQQYATEQKLSAMDGIARQQLADIETADEQGMNAAIETSIASGNTQAIDAQIKSMSGRRNSTDIGIRKQNAMLQYEDGMTKADIKEVLHFGGIADAEDYIKSLQISDDRKKTYTSYTRQTAESEITSSAAKVQETADRIQRDGGTMYDVADAIKGDRSIPNSYREKFANQYEFAGDTDQLKERIHLSGKADGLEWLNDPARKYTTAELEQQRANADIIEANELIKIKDQFTQVAQKAADEGTAFVSVYKAIEEGEGDIVHKETAISAVEAVHAKQLNTIFEGRYKTERYDLEMLQQHRDEIQKSNNTKGPYTHQEQLANIHLDRLDREIAGFKDPTGPDYNAMATKYLNTKYVQLNNGDTTVKDVLAEISDPTGEPFKMLIETTKLQPFMKDMLDYSITEGPYSSIAKGFLDDFETLLKTGKDVEPEEVNRLRAGLGIQLLNYIDGNQNVNEAKLQKIYDDYRSQTIGKLFNDINASYSGNPGDMKTEDQVWKLQKALDTENMHYTVDKQGNVSIPPANQAAMQQHVEVMRNKLSSMLGATPAATFHSGYASLGDPTKVNPGFTEGEDGKVSANPIYVVTRNGVTSKYMFAASETKGEYDLYEIIDGKLSLVTLLENGSSSKGSVSAPIMTRAERAAKDILGTGTPEPIKENETALEKAQREAKKLGIY